MKEYGTSRYLFRPDDKTSASDIRTALEKSRSTEMAEAITDDSIIDKKDATRWIIKRDEEITMELAHDPIREKLQISLGDRKVSLTAKEEDGKLNIYSPSSELIERIFEGVDEFVEKSESEQLRVTGSNDDRTVIVLEVK